MRYFTANSWLSNFSGFFWNCLHGLATRLLAFTPAFTHFSNSPHLYLSHERSFHEDSGSIDGLVVDIDGAKWEKTEEVGVKGTSLADWRPPASPPRPTSAPTHPPARHRRLRSSEPRWPARRRYATPLGPDYHDARGRASVAGWALPAGSMGSVCLSRQYACQTHCDSATREGGTP